MKKQTKTVENNNEKKTCRFGKLSRRLQVLLGVLIALLVLLVGLAWSRLQLYQQLYAPSQPVEHPTPTSTPRPTFTPTPTPFRMSPGRLSYILDDAYKLKPIFFHILARVDSSDNNRERTTINHYYTDRQLGCALSVTFRKLPQEYLSFLVKIGTLSSIKDLNDSTEDLSSQFSNEVYILSNEAPYPDPFSEEARLLPVMQQFGKNCLIQTSWITLHLQNGLSFCDLKLRTSIQW